MSRQIVEKCINLGLLLGFLVLTSGVMLWLSDLARRFELGLAMSLLAFGLLLLIFAFLAAKIVSAVD